MLSSVIFAAVAALQGVMPAFVGSWVGTLEYRDFSDDSRVKLGTLLRVYQPKGSSNWIFRYVYDDGPKKVVQESDQVSVDWAKHGYVVMSEDGKESSRYTIDGSGLKADGTGRAILSGTGTENGVKVDIRTTMTITSNHLTLLRESRLPGKGFVFRHEYSFSRVDGS